LVVIAIIGILAAIIFPVYSRVKDSAYRSSDMSNMNAIRTALQLYRSDQGGFPPALLGYATGYMNNVPSAADIVPANLVANASPWTQNAAFLYPKRVNSLAEMTPAYDRTSNVAFTTAVWPEGIAPQVDPANPQGTTGDVVSRCADIIEPGGTDNGPQLVTNYYYNVSGYDVGTVTVPTSINPNGTQTELRYAPFWSQYTVPVSCAPPTFTTPTGTQTTGGSASDSPRQLGYSDPPETTVITWDSYFREYDSDGTVVGGEKRDIVLFWGGSARMVNSATVVQQGFQANP